VAHAFHLGTDLPTRPPAESEEAELELTVEESYHGTTRTVTVTSHDNTQTLHVVIPPGVIDGDRIEVPTQLPGGRATPAVFLRVRLAPPERYQLDGRDLHVPLPLAPWEAALGATIALDTPGRPANIEVPAGTCTGHVLTLPGLGIPNPTGPAGDLHAHVRIVLPARLTPAERDLFRRLAETSTFDPRTTAAPARNHADH
jgi:curved DNA-binding protein